MQDFAGYALFLPQGVYTFSTCLPSFPPRGFHGQIFSSDKHKICAPKGPIGTKPPTKTDPNYSPLKIKNQSDLKKIHFIIYSQLL